MRNLLKYGLAVLAVTTAMVPITAYADNTVSEAKADNAIIEQVSQVTQSDDAAIKDDSQIYKLTEGWNKGDDGWYYVKNGNLLKFCIEKIDGYYYGFDHSGRMYDDEAFGMAHGNARAKKGGKLYCDEWYKDKESGLWYYYYSSCWAGRGLGTVNGKKYYFSNDGFIYTNTAISDSEDGNLYITDKNGEASIANEGWNSDGDYWYYVNNGEFVKGKVQISGDYYYFNNNSQMKSNESFSIYDSSTYKYIHMHAKKNGKLCRDEWYRDEKGYWYYYDADCVAFRNCFSTINGKMYYFNGEGKMLENIFYVDSTNKELYKIDANGVAVKVTKEGWVYSGTIWYYINSDGKMSTGLKKIGSDWYGFNTSGQCIINSTSSIDGKRYYFDVNGKMVSNKWIRNGSTYLYAKSSGELATGDTKISGKWYTFDSWGYMLTGMVKSSDGKLYYYNSDGTYWGEIKSTGWVSKNNAWYYITEEGVMYKSGAYTVSDGNVYAFNSSGKMIKSQFYNNQYYLDSTGKAVKGWFKNNGKWYYANPETARLALGFTVIDGKTYCFDAQGKMITGKVKDGNMCYSFDDNGIMTEKKTINGWEYIDGKVYYYKDGEAYTGWVGDYYVSDGWMMKDTIITTNGNSYLLDKLGKWVKSKGWHNRYSDDEYYYYVDSKGRVVSDQWIKDNGNWYYVSPYKYRYSNTTVLIDGEYQVFDENGVWLGTPKNNNGWVKRNNQWYYYKSGFGVTGRQFIDGKYYYFDYDGKMLSDFVMGNRYYGKDGAQVNYTGWKNIKGNWCYFKSDYQMASGWLNEGGKYYYLANKYVDELGSINATITNKKVCLFGDNVMNYTFDKDGVLTKTEKVVSGWVKVNSYGELRWAYVKDGSFVDGMAQIDGKMYILRSYEGLYTNSVVFCDGKNFYCDKNGVVVTKEGWYKDSLGKDVYVDQNGYAVIGIVRWNGKDYISGY